MQPYNSTITKPNHYIFTTDAGCEYECYFFTIGDVFSDYPKLSPLIFGFNLGITYKPEGKLGLDRRIATTVVTIIKNFLDKKTNVVVYICDNSDTRENARFHKFTHWFSQSNNTEIIQLKGVIRAGGTNILNAMLIHKKNKHINQFIEAYEILSGIYTKPDDDELNNILNDDGDW